ncbi:MFS transporter [Streptomyces sp. NPDC002055]|uniref:MFS transporter n=1 Tax=Streptomyces sp. NPDC002055 TaxID=3154534 RepID=UPI00333329C9
MRKTEAGENSSPRLGWVLSVVVAAQFMVTLDASVVNVALPAVRADLGFSEAGLLWVVNAYTLVFGGFLLLGGRVADLFGKRRVLWVGLGLFGLASLSGGLAQEPSQLVVARLVQGLGAAVLAPVALTIVTTTFPEGVQRTKALTLWSVAGASGGAAGVLIGGLLTDYLNWRWVLLINVPIVLFAAVAGKEVPQGLPEQRSRLDVMGAVLASTGLAALVYGVVRTGDDSLTSPTALGFLGGGLVLLVAFVLYEVKGAREPLVQLRLFAHRSVTGANVAMLLLASGQFASFYFVSLYLQRVLHFTPAVAGLAFLPFCVGFTTAAMVSGRLLARVGPRMLVVAGTLIGALGLAWFSRIAADGSFLANILGPSLLASSGIGACFVPLANAATGSVSQQEAGMASGLLNSGQQVGGSLGLAVTVSVATSHTASLTGRREPTLEALNSGYGSALLAGAGLLVLAAVVALILPGRPRSLPSLATDPDDVPEATIAQSS